jgi:hypothetical protein
LFILKQQTQSADRLDSREMSEFAMQCYTGVSKRMPTRPMAIGLVCVGRPELGSIQAFQSGNPGPGSRDGLIRLWNRPLTYILPSFSHV